MQLKDATVLVVDDESFLCEIISEWFARVAKNVLSAENGALAVKLLAEHPVDLIISDVRTPVMDGVELVKHIKGTRQYAPSIIFISGFTDLEAREAYGLGVVGIMEKPVPRRDLLAAAERALAGRTELWQTPVTPDPEITLNYDFTSIASAMKDRQIAFGQGGFCISSPLGLRRVPVKLALNFKADQHSITGHGFVRWTCYAEQKIGVEIAYIDKDNRTWMIDLPERTQAASFIPGGIGA